MALTREKTEHICERARRALAQIDRDVKPVFIIYRSGEFETALNNAKQKWERSRAGKILLKFLSEMQEPSGPQFSGIVYYNPRNLIPFLRQEQILAPVFVNIDNFIDPAEAQHQVYHSFWHILNLLNDFRLARKTPETQDYTQKKFILKPQYLKFKETRHNLIADIFGAFMTEFEQKSNFIEKLALIRAERTIQKTPGFLLEKYPYPLVAEASRLVFDDLKSAFEDINQLFPVAFKMASEVASTYGDEVIQQWRDFCLPAQEMAWLDYAPETILGNAVFTAEDPYVRTSAYLICELLEHTAEPAANRNLYNPYATGEKNRSLHFRACEEAFHRILSRAASMSDPSAFIEEVRRQNKQLAQGNPTGWCAYAIMESGNVFEKCLQTELTIEDVSDAFQKALPRVNWEDILKVSRTIITMHREKKDFRFK
ncbi:MAG: hypothetical protein LRZ85_07915 [Alphaproteobacteria bacterium]|nr:hypothetical protein [Alphaproteobacteria bacterium]